MVDEILEMYKVEIPRIFVHDSKLQKGLTWFSKKVAGIPIVPYSENGLNTLFQGMMGTDTLKDFGRQCSCIAAFVARTVVLSGWILWV